jgi:hypothetical protein
MARAPDLLSLTVATSNAGGDCASAAQASVTMAIAGVILGNATIDRRFLMAIRWQRQADLTRATARAACALKEGRKNGTDSLFSSKTA